MQKPSGAGNLDQKVGKKKNCVVRIYSIVAYFSLVGGTAL